LSSSAVADIVSQRLFGRFEIAGRDAIVLDSSAPHVPGSRGEVTDEQLDFLRATLPDVEDALLFVHHPIHYHNVEDNPWWDVYPERAFCGNKKEINHIIDQHGGIRAVFNAHLHEHDHTVYRGIDHVTVEPFSRKTPGDGPTGAHAVVEIDDEIQVTMKDSEEKIAAYTF
ncbi:MAG: metallophosphoesterase, partial [Candidatus Nanohaloarchaea archaeon]